MVSDVVEHSRDQAAIVMGEEVREATNCLKDFLFDRVYLAGAAEDREHVERVIGALFRFCMEHPEEVPGGAEGEIARRTTAGSDSEAAALDQRRLARLVCDHVAGMTDRFASQQFLQFYLPRRWWRDA
jgi:dGTPase